MDPDLTPPSSPARSDRDGRAPNLPGRADSNFTVRWLVRTLVVVAISLVVFSLFAVAFLRPGPDDAVIIGATRMAWDPERDDPLGEGKAASVEIFEEDGRYRAYVYDIDVLRPPAESEFLEVWLVSGTDDSGVDRLSVGTFDSIRTRVFVLPDDVDPLDYDRVVFSLEPDDGDPGFSGRTMMSGELVWLSPPPQD